MNRTARAIGGRAPCIIPLIGTGSLHNHANQGALTHKAETFDNKPTKATKKRKEKKKKKS